jgi:hypothetical protein
MAAESTHLTQRSPRSAPLGPGTRGALRIKTGWARCLRADLLAEIAQIEARKRRIFQIVDLRRTEATANALAALRERLAEVETMIAACETAPQD